MLLSNLEQVNEVLEEYKRLSKFRDGLQYKFGRWMLSYHSDNDYDDVETVIEIERNSAIQAIDDHLQVLIRKLEVLGVTLDQPIDA